LQADQPFPLPERQILRFVNQQNDVIELRVVGNGDEALLAQVNRFGFFRRLCRVGEFEARCKQQLMPKSRFACLAVRTTIPHHQWHHGLEALL
jgi:hypothetical protein